MQPTKSSRVGRPNSGRSGVTSLALALFVSVAACTSPASSRFAGGADWTGASYVWFARSGFVTPDQAYNFRVAIAGRGAQRSVVAELQRGASACAAEFRLTAAESERLNRAFRELSFCRGVSAELSVLTSDQPVAGLELELDGRALRLIRNTRVTSADRICGGEAAFGIELKRALERGLPANCPTYEALFATDRLP
jgi:hypothetical protein